MDVVTIGWVSTIFLLAAAMFQIPFGKLGDLYGRKKVSFGCYNFYNFFKITKKNLK